jgi:hypothetical protein
VNLDIFRNLERLLRVDVKHLEDLAMLLVQEIRGWLVECPLQDSGFDIDRIVSALAPN